MKALIIEDEKAAVRNLKALLKEVAPDTEVTEVLDSVTDSVAWFESNHAPDVVFMDIHLADGSSFEIFEHVRIDCPIIFTTAYDEYALRAFKVNSVDYLLKPIGAADLQRALDKLKTLHHTPDQSNALSALINALQKHGHYKTHFLTPYKGDKLLPLAVDQITLLPRKPAIPYLTQRRAGHRPVVQQPTGHQPQDSRSGEDPCQQTACQQLQDMVCG